MAHGQNLTVNSAIERYCIVTNQRHLETLTLHSVSEAKRNAQNYEREREACVLQFPRKKIEYKVSSYAVALGAWMVAIG